MKNTNDLTPMAYNELIDFLNGKVSKKLTHNTVVERDDDLIYIRLYSTDIITVYKNGNLKLDTGGHYSVTTKQRLNGLIPSGCYIHQKDYQWYYTDNQGEVVKFMDDMIISKTGKIVR